MLSILLFTRIPGAHTHAFLHGCCCLLVFQSDCLPAFLLFSFLGENVKHVLFGAFSDITSQRSSYLITFSSIILLQHTEFYDQLLNPIEAQTTRKQVKILLQHKTTKRFCLVNNSIPPLFSYNNSQSLSSVLTSFIQRILSGLTSRLSLSRHMSPDDDDGGANVIWCNSYVVFYQ